jgi:hypothetical protein
MQVHFGDLKIHVVRARDRVGAGIGALRQILQCADFVAVEGFPLLDVLRKLVLQLGVFTAQPRVLPRQCFKFGAVFRGGGHRAEQLFHPSHVC